jgi:hypothetical protein
VRFASAKRNAVFGAKIAVRFAFVMRSARERQLSRRGLWRDGGKLCRGSTVLAEASILRDKMRERGKTRNLCGIIFTRRDCVNDRFSSSGQPTASAQRVNY